MFRSWVILFLGILSNLNSNNRKIDKLMATVTQRFDKISTDLQEGFDELNKAIQDAKNDDTLSESAEASLEKIEAQAKSLADVIPNEPPAEDTPAETSPTEGTTTEGPGPKVAV